MEPRGIEPLTSSHAMAGALPAELRPLAGASVASKSKSSAQLIRRSLVVQRGCNPQLDRRPPLDHFDRNQEASVELQE